MAFNPNPPKAEYQATAGQTNFPFLFKIYFTSDIKVYHTPISTGETVLLTEGIGYSVAINGDDGGTVTLILVVENNDYIVLERELELTRYVEYQTSGDLLSGTLNADQDYQTYLVSDQNALRDNSLYLPNGTFGVDTEIPFPVAGYFFRWNSTGTAVEYGAPSTVTVPWGNIDGTLSDQTDLQNELNALQSGIDAKLPSVGPAFTGTLSGPIGNISTMGMGAATATTLNIGQAQITYDVNGLKVLGNNGNNDLLLIDYATKTLHQTSTDLTWGGTPVVVGNASSTNVGGIKILVSGTDCYITTDGSTPGP